jgi:hypothetical protein
MPPRRRTTSNASNVTELEKIHLNLDEWEDPDRVKVPFSVVVGGKRVVLIDPKDLDWQDVARIDRGGDPMLFFEYCFSDEDKAHFMGQKVSSRKMDALMKMYFRHYKIEMPEGNASASST